MLDRDKMEKLKEMIGVDNIEIIQASSPEEGMAKIREILEKKLTESEKSEIVDEILHSGPATEKYVAVGATIANLLMEAGVPREVANGGCLAVAGNCALVDYAMELKKNPAPCEIAAIRDENLIPLVKEIEEKIKPIISTLPTNKVVAALSGIALKVICDEEELKKKMSKNKIDPMDAIKKALDSGNLVEAQGILNTILKNK